MYGIIIDIPKGIKPKSKFKGITRDFLIGKKFRSIEGGWTRTYLEENTGMDKYHKIDGYLIYEDGSQKYFLVDAAKIKRYDHNESHIKKYKEFLIEGNVFKKENETKNLIDSFLYNNNMKGVS